MSKFGKYFEKFSKIPLNFNINNGIIKTSFNSVSNKRAAGCVPGAVFAGLHRLSAICASVVRVQRKLKRTGSA